jgi:N-methylhydantoinase A
MQSHGGVTPIAEAMRLAASAILSGPAGGVAGSQYCARLLAEGNLIAFDMGGTSTDISVLQGGEPFLTGDKAVSGLKVALPSIDIHTLGAGGGSVAHVDLGGILHVGPQSAGADPGPACYGKGGMVATVTDANLVLGYLDPGNFLGGRTPLDANIALTVVESIAKQLGTTAVAAAEGIHRVVNTNMAEGIRLVSARRGVDPRRFALLAFGGAAGLHITEVARLLEITRVVVPRVAAVLSAWGMLAMDLPYELVRTHIGEVQKVGAAELRQLFIDMEADGRVCLAKAFSGPVRIRRAADMRYGEQIFEITVPLDGVDINAPDLIQQVAERFHRRHEELYTYSAPDQEVVLVNVRLAMVGELPMLPAEPIIETSGALVSQGSRRVYLGGWIDVPIYGLDTLQPGHEMQGPAIIESATTTILVRQGDRVLITLHGWLDIQLG